jgi:nitrogen regulatory protein PII 1
MCVVNAADKEFVINTIMDAARSGAKGAFGDGKIFVSDVEDVYTISSGVNETAAASEEAA